MSLASFLFLLCFFSCMLAMRLLLSRQAQNFYRKVSPTWEKGVKLWLNVIKCLFFSLILYSSFLLFRPMLSCNTWITNQKSFGKRTWFIPASPTQEKEMLFNFCISVVSFFCDLRSYFLIGCYFICFFLSASQIAWEKVGSANHSAEIK